MAVIVVAEDDPDLRRIYRMMLQRADHTVHEADNGLDALALTRNCQPDLVLTDHTMPK